MLVNAFEWREGNCNAMNSTYMRGSRSLNVDFKRQGMDWPSVVFRIATNREQKRGSKPFDMSIERPTSEHDTTIDVQSSLSTSRNDRPWLEKKEKSWKPSNSPFTRHDGLQNGWVAIVQRTHIIYEIVISAVVCSRPAALRLGHVEMFSEESSLKSLLIDDPVSTDWFKAKDGMRQKCQRSDRGSVYHRPSLQVSTDGHWPWCLRWTYALAAAE